MNKPFEGQEALWVCAGATADIQSDKIVITLTHTTAETSEAYVQRCNEIVSFVINKSPKPEPNVIDFSDTSKFKQVGPNAYEAITSESIDKTE